MLSHPQELNNVGSKISPYNAVGHSNHFAWRAMPLYLARTPIPLKRGTVSLFTGT